MSENEFSKISKICRCYVQIKIFIQRKKAREERKPNLWWVPDVTQKVLLRCVEVVFLTEKILLQWSIATISASEKVAFSFVLPPHANLIFRGKLERFVALMAVIWETPVSLGLNWAVLVARRLHNDCLHLGNRKSVPKVRQLQEWFLNWNRLNRKHYFPVKHDHIHSIYLLCCVPPVHFDN